ncbi:unnamed protein product [Didymodactylos carnosus]|uniref:Uncharacterized protein n=1 Tax=Didymodactylos carnosus TaxID=1234261 RepID=A0A8S2FYT3_9BILA|nr:unnamed protein product [Didymodactylos carnosus]CAF4396650.1 unnamed protein product [Didymodactylos carnosus]
MYISEIPVRIDDTMTWLTNLDHSTSARDVIHALLSNLDTHNDDIDDYTLYVHTDRDIHPLLHHSKIYKVVASIQKHQCGRRLLFEIKHRHVSINRSKYVTGRSLRQSSKKQKSDKLRPEKRVRFSNEIQIQDINGRCWRDRCNGTSPVHFLEALFILNNEQHQGVSENELLTNENDEVLPVAVKYDETEFARGEWKHQSTTVTHLVSTCVQKLHIEKFQ